MNDILVKRIKDILTEYSIVFVMFFAVIIFCFIDPTLVSARNIRNVFSDLAPLLLASIGVAMCFFTGHMDITSGVVAGFAGLIAGALAQRADLTERMYGFGPLSPVLIILLVMILFSLIGLLYAVVMAKTTLHARVFTVAFSILLLGLSNMYASTYNFDSLEIAGFSDGFLKFGVGYVGSNPVASIPYTVICMTVMLIAVFIYLKVLNIHIISVHIEDESKNLNKYILLYMPATAFFALAGIMLAARTNSATPTSAIHLSIETITICLIAGFSIKGDRGRLPAVIVAAILYVALMYCIKFLGLNSYSKMVVQGILSIGALLLDYYISNKKETA